MIPRAYVRTSLPSISRPLRPIAVQLDGLDDRTESPIWFPALTRGELWNGFATPYFEWKAANEIVAAFNEKTRLAGGTGTQASYDGFKDAFVFIDEEGEREEFKGQVIGARKLYPIGAWFWAWTSKDSEN